MTFRYEYNGKLTCPCMCVHDPNNPWTMTDGIHFDVAGSAMTDKNIEGCAWYEDTGMLYIDWQNELSPADKAILDAIVEANS